MACLWLVIASLAFAASRPALANGNDLPQQITLQAFVKQENGKAEALVRVPLVLLSNLALPKRGPGYLDLSNIYPRLRQAAALIGRQVELSSQGEPLSPNPIAVQLALPSDRSFASYSSAVAHMDGPPLPVNTDLFGTQGYFDVRFEYRLPAGANDVSVRLNVSPELTQRIKLQLDYFAVGEPARSFEIIGGSGWIPLEPRWYQAMGFFAKIGFMDVFTLDRCVFLICLIAPFRNIRGCLALGVGFAALQALTLTAMASGALIDVEIGWLPLFCNAAIATAMVLLAIANLSAPSLRRRCLLATLVGALAGFGLGAMLGQASAFAGTHPVIAAASFNAGAALASLAIVAISFFLLRLAFANVLGPALGVTALSAIIGNAAWSGMTENAGELWRQLGRVPAANLWPALTQVSLWLVPALVVSTGGYVALKHMHGQRVRTLREALRPRDKSDTSGSGMLPRD